jgi:F0F1-type ATP synthase alpha subunit
MIDGPYNPEAVAARAVVNKAEGGVMSLVDIARNMNRGPRGVDSLAPVARNMYRTMVS